MAIAFPKHEPTNASTVLVPEELFWIERERLGVLEFLLLELANSNKKKRAAAFRSIQTVLKRLKLIPSDCTVTRMGMATNRLGAVGLLISTFMPREVDAQLPEDGPNYAHERST